MTFKDKREQTELAVALDYAFDSSGAPTISAVGNGSIAKKMQQIARRYGVPIEQDSKLTAQLSHLTLNQEVPPGSYRDVARILLKHMPK